MSAGSFTDIPADLAISDVVGLNSGLSDLNSKFSLNSSSGNIISSDINSSSNNTGRLLIYRRDFVQGCYLQGNVTDISNGNAIAAADILTY